MRWCWRKCGVALLRRNSCSCALIRSYIWKSVFTIHELPPHIFILVSPTYEIVVLLLCHTDENVALMSYRWVDKFSVWDTNSCYLTRTLGHPYEMMLQKYEMALLRRHSMQLRSNQKLYLTIGVYYPCLLWLVRWCSKTLCALYSRTKSIRYHEVTGDSTQTYIYIYVPI